MKRQLELSKLTSTFVGRLLLPQLTGALFLAHDHALARFGLTARQAAILVNCDLGEANTPVDLARLHALEVSSITRLVDRLEKKGMLKRTRSKTDRRQVILQVTPKAAACLMAAAPFSAEVSRRAWSGVSEREKKVLVKVANKILKNLEKGPGSMLNEKR